MNKFLLSVFLLLGVFVFTGCEDYFGSKVDDDVVFINKSSYTVQVTPSANSGWAGFRIAPGENHKIRNPRDIFFTFEPKFRVEVGENENGRVLFINLKEDTVQVD